MPVVLLDTNVWVSAFINPHGHPARLRDAWVAGRFEVVVSIPLLEEIADVLTRPRIQNKYGLTTEEIEEFLHLLQQRGRHVTPTGELQLCRDPDDDLILETAALGGARYAVSRDDDLKGDSDLVANMIPMGVEVLSVQHFLDRLEAGLL
ncbi:MAG: putative toxin-antitoxin system toxin component, PIN family [Anaerolineales bacterium]|nr:putative toxin-antitoxin system toxin component, PIN family [Anaerolineales bacterium]